MYIKTNNLKSDYKLSFLNIFKGFQGLYLLVLTILKTLFFGCFALYKAITQDVQHHDFVNNSNKK